MSKTQKSSYPHNIIADLLYAYITTHVDLNRSNHMRQTKLEDTTVNAQGHD